MKDLLRIITLFAVIILNNNSNAQTTVANGNWSNPATWGGVPPMGSGTVIINHVVTLDVDYSHTSGSITINVSGALNGNSPMRVFALNYPSGTATLTTSGAFNVARVPLVSGTVNNNGTFQSDSLLNSATLTNNSGATINAAQFMINTGGTLNNSGSVISTNYFNIASVTNAGSITSNDFTNSKSFTNSNAGIINIAHDFSNIDTLASPAIFTNDGIVSVGNDWHNGNQINGSGKFCIANNTWNSGAMTGIFDFCDQTGGSIDLNTGTVAGTITNCFNPCGVGLAESSVEMLFIIYPNPFSTQATLQADENMEAATLAIYNSFGQQVKQIKNISGMTITLYRDNLPSGLYFIQMTQDDKIFITDKLVIADN